MNKQPTSTKPPAVNYQTPGANKPTSDRETYNVVTDTVLGPNIRLKDNLLQAAVIAITALLGGISGFIFGTIRYGLSEAIMPALIGAFIGLLVGLFGSGLFLGIYRAVRHAKGRHD